MQDVRIPALARGLAPAPRPHPLTPGLTVIGDHDALRRAVGDRLSDAVRRARRGRVVRPPSAG
ncbi:hypothetical protein [Streptomyces hawaiiensis]|uniref:Uncharacterized protein n=1 Tax=Streptomyces hawaiiensis TaxID=67305 RepID=A0A6G5RNI1_9ACTN|nr:hypothetical protein [Streptomyces hawaiiensis]QCD59580.1 hypothetical protein CEB94_35840 [Streptomyces hawaiiensis]